MIDLFMALTALAVQAPTAPARTLQSLQGVTVQYYDVAGDDADGVRKSLQKILKAPPPNKAAEVYSWALEVGINKHTEGTTCTVSNADAKLKASVYLPRLTTGNKVPKDVAVKFDEYTKQLESTASDNLWFVADRLPAIQQSLVGKPCDGVAALWNQATTNLVKEQSAFAKARAEEK